MVLQKRASQPIAVLPDPLLSPEYRDAGNVTNISLVPALKFTKLPPEELDKTVSLVKVVEFANVPIPTSHSVLKTIV